jgi:cytochrome c oxidase assembly protein subunit 15
MVVALFIAMVPLLILSILNGKDRFVNKPLKITSTLLLVISFIQIILGTQVREAIDVISKRYKYQSRELWISELDIEFIIHRSFSWIVISLAGYLLDKLKGVSYIIVGIVILTIVFGLIMAFLNVPAIAQPLHLLLASLLIMAVWWYRLQLK